MITTKRKMVATSFYAFGLIHHLYTYYYSHFEIDFTKGDQKIQDVHKYSNRFLTTWNMSIQTLYFVLSLTFEILLLNKEKISPALLQSLNKIKGYFFATLILPSTAVVALFFWVFYHLNKTYLMPEGLEQVVPGWVNHCIHTNIVLLPIVEILLQTSMYIPTAWKAIVGLTIYSHVYNSVYLFTYFETGKWMYPIYDTLSWPQRICLMEFMFVTGMVACQLHIFIQNMRAKSGDYTTRKYRNRVVTNVTKKLL